MGCRREATSISLWLDCRNASNAILLYETAPAFDDNLFALMGSITMAGTSAPLITNVLILQNPAVPLAAFVRWKLKALAAGAPYEATFRVRAVLGS